MKSELNKEFEEAFKSYKEELGFNSSLEKLDSIFFIRDQIQREDYISKDLGRQVARRIVDLYNSWLGYIHGLMMPNPSSMFSVTESQMFDEQEKEELIKLMNKALELTTRNTLIGLNNDKEKEKEFIDYSVEFWDNEFKPKLIKMMNKINLDWDEKAKE